MPRRHQPNPRRHGELVTEAERDRFDALIEEAIDQLPDNVRDLLEEAPVIVEDCPPEHILRELEITDPTELCGLHTGTAITERSVEHGHDLPEEIRLFRAGIVKLAGGWAQPEADQKVFEEIWVTLLHEIGHHFGLDEDDLDRLGYA
ncbi:MAG: metallopeptidase family protein [Phycisphaerales bacterium]